MSKTLLKQKEEQSWFKVQFKDLCDIITERVDNPKESNLNYYVGLEHLESEQLKIKNHGNSNDVVSSKFRFKPGQVLFGRRRVYLRKLAVADKEGICSTDIFVLQPKEDKINKSFLPLFMQGEEFQQRVMKLSAGSLSPRVKWKNISKEQFWIPSFDSQSLIVKIISIIDDYYQKTENLIEKTIMLKKILQNQLLTKGIGHTKFKKIKTSFGDEEIPEEWNLVKLYEICKKITSGGTPLRINSSYYGGNIPWIKSGELNNGYLYDSEEKITIEGLQNSSAKIFPKNAVLIAMYGATIGQTAILGKEASTNQAICALIPDKSLHYLFLHQYLIFKMRNIINLGTGAGQPNISQEIIKNIRLPLPGIKEQQKIAIILSEIDEQVQLLKSHLLEINQMRKSLLNSFLTLPRDFVGGI